MNAKSKGSNAEREIIHQFWEAGWAALRVAGSGSIKYPVPDLIAGNGIRNIAIECKATKDKHKYFEKREIEELKWFSQVFGAEALVSVKFNNQGTYFIKIEDLLEKSKSFMTNLEIAQKKGQKFDELIK